jgi:hypothetical protein
MSELMLIPDSKSQFESHFKKWGLRKNLTRVEWRRLILYMKQNSISDEQVQILFKDTEVSRERVLREIARYGSSCYQNDPGEGNDKAEWFALHR